MNNFDSAATVRNGEIRTIPKEEAEAAQQPIPRNVFQRVVENAEVEKSPRTAPGKGKRLSLVGAIRVAAERGVERPIHSAPAMMIGDFQRILELLEELEGCILEDQLERSVEWHGLPPVTRGGGK